MPRNKPVGPFAVDNLNITTVMEVEIAYAGRLDEAVRFYLGTDHPEHEFMRCVAVVPTLERWEGCALRGARLVYWVKVDRLEAQLRAGEGT
jgi:hypothetical protein